MKEFIIDEEKLKEYYKNGGTNYLVTDISIVRDATHILIVTSKDKYFYNKNTGQFLKSIREMYDSSVKIGISDELEIYYLKERIYSYIKDLEGKLEYSKFFLSIC